MKSITKFQTNLNCGSCVAAVTPFLNGEPAIENWSVDTKDPRKILTVRGSRVAPEVVEQLVRRAGFKTLARIEDESEKEATRTAWSTYYPLALIVMFLLGGTALLSVREGTFFLHQAMNYFMGGFFLVFSFFKLLNLRGFVDAFMTYDVLAKRMPAYGFVYPFIELGLGIAYVLGVYPEATNAFTVAIMMLGIVGVSQALLEKRKIQCACLGTVFNLPMSKVTFFENAIMAGMALTMIVLQ